MKPETETKNRRERLKGMINNAETNRAFDLLRAEDSESQIAQRYLAVLANMCSDAGGLDRCTEVRLQLIRRFSALAVHAELMDSKFIAGKDVDVLRYAVISSTLCRIASRIGMKRAVKQVPYLSEYMEINANNKLEPQEPLEPGIDEAHTSNGGGPQQWRVTILH